MNNVKVNFDSIVGKVKPMHAVNNGPVYKFAPGQRITNIEAYMAAGIPYARNHDAAFYATYGGEHIVDVHAIFPNFDADENNPKSYDFTLTDEYLKVIDYAGTKTFYRLGSKIEHWPKKYGTLPPKDFAKWARICEHIIRHYTEGWADGFNYDIEYWEIWNEPDLHLDDSTHKTCWGGTKAEFFEFYNIAATHLKKCFPHLKIGGPAASRDCEWADEFMAQLGDAPLDFFSWHTYQPTPEKIVQRAENMRARMKKHGYEKSESILNEWNYVKGWTGDEWVYSLKTEKNLKGSSFIAATMGLCQYKGGIDMLMYYDARPCGMNGMFNTDFVNETLKGYYPFKMFNTLYQMKSAAEVENTDDVYTVAATNGKKAAIMVTHYNDDEATEKKTVKVDIKGFAGKDGVRAKFYLLDDNNDLELVREEIFMVVEYSLVINMDSYSSYLITIEKL